MRPPNSYLPHLDGLRCIALSSVLFFHFRVPYFRGGYTGVDIFLSLSGFLISRNLLHQLSLNKFSLPSFYIRRFYRLYPAALLTTFCSLLLSFLSLPSPLALAVANAARASLLLHSNTHFHLSTNYFSPDAALQPLLHTWSLSLEEQFYIIWPALLAILFRVSSTPHVPVAVALVLLILSSFFIAVVSASYFPSFAFYELPPRLFQFAAGALVALFRFHTIESDPVIPSKLSLPLPSSNDLPSPVSSLKNSKDPAKAIHAPLWQNALAYISLLALQLSFTFLPPGSPPHHTAVVTLFTCVLLALPQAYPCRTFLSVPFVGALGRLSYSAYLVHWPLYVFSAHILKAMRYKAGPNALVMLVGTFVLASWMRDGVEEPVRKANNWSRRRGLFWVGLVVTGMFTVWGVASGGWKDRFEGVKAKMGETGTAAKIMCVGGEGGVDRSLGNENEDSWGCRIGDGEGKRSRYVFFGDSFAHQMTAGLQAVGRKREVWFGLHFRTGCRFWPRGGLDIMKKSGVRCMQSHERLWAELDELQNGSVIVVANSWWWGSREQMKVVLSELQRDVAESGNHELMVVGEAPGVNEREADYFSCADVAIMPLVGWWYKMRGLEWGGAKRCFENGKVEFTPFDGRLWQWASYKELADSGLKGLRFLDYLGYLCDGLQGVVLESLTCRPPAELEGGFLYEIGYKRDLRHLTYNGSLFMADLYEKTFLGEGDVVTEGQGAERDTERDTEQKTNAVVTNGIGEVDGVMGNGTVELLQTNSTEEASIAEGVETEKVSEAGDIEERDNEEGEESDEEPQTDVTEEESKVEDVEKEQVPQSDSTVEESVQEESSADDVEKELVAQSDSTVEESVEEESSADDVEKELVSQSDSTVEESVEEESSADDVEKELVSQSDSTVEERVEGGDGRAQIGANLFNE